MLLLLAVAAAAWVAAASSADVADVATVVVAAAIDVIVRYMLSNAALADSNYWCCRDGI